jgi:hypothetical protein
MKLILIQIFFISTSLICSAQLEGLKYAKRLSITSKDVQETSFTGIIILNNQLIVSIYTNKEDRIKLENNDKAGEEKFIDHIYLYGQEIKLQIINKRKSKQEISTNSLIGRFLQMQFDDINYLINSDNLEYQIISQDQFKDSVNEWHPLTTLPQDSLGYILYTNNNSPLSKSGTQAIIHIRLKGSQKVFSTIKLVRKEIKPYKVMALHDSTGNQSFERILLAKDSLTKRVDSLYKVQLKSDKKLFKDSVTYKQDSRLMWFFAHVDKDLPDSSLRFSLQANDKDWVVREGITGHLLLLDNLQAGNDYTLKIWYALQPENSESYHFSLPPYWYNRTDIRLAFLLALLGLIFIVVKSILNKQTRKNSLRLQQAQNAFASIRAQLNPHFVFNALNSIQALMNTGNIDGANNYLSRFSKLLRTSLQPAYQGMVPLSTELELLQQYIELEQLRMPFAFKIQIEPSLDIHSIEIPGILLQPIAENAIKHGLPGATEPKLNCEIMVQNGNLIITTKNNGYPLSEKLNNGVGLKIVEEKLQILNRCFPGTNAAFKLSTFDNLTIVTITLHQWLK